ncbi:hypothetical protein DACRYDRAFT_24847 [Dacryopinax primogenitus]|uniref:Uncharacterized protein n=1 Tax=Dacryopinax primogenitus (strain DJM 731) TaxID=1858805 RepID=M5FWV0_DACPD|nr:uncharacterized protein DACRYDRAFT_24847 [Dacryopinax primogenitus]EJT97926.1 hypothetical protein DACRYDRAFT_24847 [Dacryopinax primogenitus]
MMSHSSHHSDGDNWPCLTQYPLTYPQQQTYCFPTFPPLSNGYLDVPLQPQMARIKVDIPQQAMGGPASAPPGLAGYDGIQDGAVLQHHAQLQYPQQHEPHQAHVVHDHVHYGHDLEQITHAQEHIHSTYHQQQHHQHALNAAHIEQRHSPQQQQQQSSTHHHHQQQQSPHSQHPQHYPQSLPQTEMHHYVQPPQQQTNSVLRAIDDPQTYALQNGLPPLPPVPATHGPGAILSGANDQGFPTHLHSHSHPHPFPTNSVPPIPHTTKRNKAQAPLGSSGWTPAKLYQTPIRRVGGPVGRGWRAPSASAAAGAAGAGEGEAGTRSGRSPRSLSDCGAEEDQADLEPAEPEEPELDGQAEDSADQVGPRGGKGRKRRSPASGGRPTKKRLASEAYTRALEGNLERLKRQILGFGMRPCGLEGVNECGAMTLDSAKLVIQAQQLDLDTVHRKYEELVREINQLRATMNASHALIPSQPTLSSLNLSSVNSLGGMSRSQAFAPSLPFTKEDMRRGSVESVMSTLSTTSNSSVNSIGSVNSVNSVNSIHSTGSIGSCGSVSSLSAATSVSLDTPLLSSASASSASTVPSPSEAPLGQIGLLTSGCLIPTTGTGRVGTGTVFNQPPLTQCSSGTWWEGQIPVGAD